MSKLFHFSDGDSGLIHVNDCPICKKPPTLESLCWGFVMSHQCEEGEANCAALEVNDEDLVKVVNTWNKLTGENQ